MGCSLKAEQLPYDATRARLDSDRLAHALAQQFMHIDNSGFSKGRLRPVTNMSCIQLTKMQSSFPNASPCPCLDGQQLADVHEALAA